MAYTPDFELVHIGVNCADEAQAAECAHKFELLFQLAVNPAKESADARFTGTQIEWMKKPGRGYLEEKGFSFDEESIKHFSDGRVLVIYAKEQIGGFAIHLMQK